VSSEESAPAPLRFDCPACGVLLTVPAAAAGIQGPCPRCWQEIISPEPARGLPAMLPAVSPPPPSQAHEVPPPREAPALEPPPAIPAPAPPPLEPPLPPEPPVLVATPSSAETLAPVDPTPPAIPHGSTALPETKVAGPARLGRVAAWLATAAVFSAGGYYFGVVHRGQIARASTSAPGTSPAAPTLPPRPPVPEPAPADSPQVTPAQPDPAPPPPPPEPAKLDADSTLKAFLEAHDWQTRSKHVLVPEQVRELMEKHAAQAGDGPIAVTSITLDDLQEANYLYKVRTKDMPDGFPVALVATDKGPKVDWEAFVGFHDDHFRKFAEGPVGQTGIFQLLVKPDPAENEAGSHFNRFRLAVPMPDREQLAWMRKDSVASVKLHAVFDGGPSLDKASVAEMVAHQGVPLVLALAKKETNDGRSIIEITDYIAFGWGPRREE
jgi:hypothetical protein